MRFTVDIDPIGKARPRFTKTGHAYTPQKTKDAEELIAAAYRATSGGCIPKGVPVELGVTAHFPIPKSFSQKKRDAVLDSEILPTKKPDADNILKLVADALSGVAYEDDAQVVRMEVLKEYTALDDGYIEIEIFGGEP
jgi:Holliday junction resolvase RusA-like endonuclease